MNLSVVPTDNLYKFMAVSGIVIALFSASALYNWTNEAHDRSSKNLLTVMLLKAEIDTYTEKRRRAIETGERKAGTKQDHDIELREKFVPQLIQMERAKEESDRELDRLYSVYVIGIIGVILGFFLSVLGFRLWYLRVQRYQDIEAIEKWRQAVKSKSSNAETSAKQEQII